MPWTSSHIKWLVDTGETLTTADGKTVEVWEFRHGNEDAVLSAWAKHFRNHYCLDSEIDELRDGTGLGRTQYLINFAFPDKSKAPGPSIRAGDFAEILVADFLEFILKFWVPRFRYDEKSIRNESEKGVDILGFKLVGQEGSPEDTLAAFEAKGRLTGGQRDNRLQGAVNDSVKDFYVRKAESLNALKRRLIKACNRLDALKVQRFQNQADRPYSEESGAAAVLSTSVFNPTVLSETNTTGHPNKNALKLLVIRGDELMVLVHELYKRAADEA